jgi:hypothetical protein
MVQQHCARVKDNSRDLPAAPAGLAMGATGDHLPMKIIVYHSYGQVEARFAAFPRDSFDARATKHPSLRLERTSES